MDAVVLSRDIPVLCLMNVFLYAGTGSIRPIVAEGQPFNRMPAIDVFGPTFLGLEQLKVFPTTIALRMTLWA
jgi:hypothetical protein